MAPENTLEAYAAAMDYGADGVELDLRRTADGVLVLFHDDMLDRLTNGFGDVSEITYFQLLSLQPRQVYGRAKKQTRSPTFAAVLVLARQRAMLLHLDIKRPGLEADIARLLEAADCWDHVVAVNAANAGPLRRDSRIKALRYKAPGLYENRRDVNPAAVKAALAQPGELILVDDPRVAAQALERPAYRPVPLPKGLRRRWPPRTAAPPVAEAKRPDSDDVLALTKLLLGPKRRPASAAPILSRARAAQRLGELGKPTPFVLAALEYQVRNRSLHPDWRYQGLDGAAAARSLAALGAVESVPVLWEAFLRVDPALREVQDPRWKGNPLAWTDFRLKMVVPPALGTLAGEQSKAFLQQYLAMPPAKAREIAPLLYREATAALLRQRLSREELTALLQSENEAVQGTAILACRDLPTRARTAALRASAPWVLSLPRAR